MFDTKYSKVLTVLLVIVIIAIVGIIAYIGYDFYKKYYIDKDALNYLEKYEDQVKNDNEEDTKEEQNNEITNLIDQIDSSTTGGSSGSSTKQYTYKGFNVVGTIEIPKTNIKYPILENVTKKSIETAVAMLYGPGPNEIGNTVIIGHNYRNGAFFGKNKQLSNGDTIYITDNSGKKVKYTIYNIYTTTPDDSTYMTRDTAGKREISLSTCTDDSKGRLIIWAKE